MTARDGPQDRYKAVWLIFFILGLGTLLPWNFFMTAREYFISRLGDPEETSHVRNQTGEATFTPSYLQSVFDNFMTLCAMVPLLIFTCLNSFIHQRIPQQIRISGSLVAIGLVFLVTAIMVKVPMDPLPFFVFTMISIVFINSFGAILQSSLFGLAGLLPVSYTAPIMSGQGLAGTFAALAMIFSIAIGAQQPESFIGYFTTACVTIVLAIVSYVILPHMDFFRYYSMKDKTEYHVYNAELETKRDLIKKDENGMEQNNSKIIPIHNPDEQPSVIAIFKKLWVLALSVCFVFTVTIGVFPAITANVSTVLGEGNKWGLYFIPVSCFLLFNVFDWTGRSLTALFTWPGMDSCLLPVMVVLRVIFVPLFMLCNVQPRYYLPVVFSHDAWYIIFMIFFSISNGYLASLCMCFGPKDEEAVWALRFPHLPHRGRGWMQLDLEGSKAWHSTHSRVSSLAQHRQHKEPTGVREGCPWCQELQGGLPKALYEPMVWRLEVLVALGAKGDFFLLFLCCSQASQLH